MKKLTIISYGIFLLLFSIFSYLFTDPNLSYLKNFYSGFASSNRLLVTTFYVFSIVVFFIFYSVFIYLGAKKKVNLKEIFALLSMTVVGLIFSYPAMLSYDIFNYIATSKVLFFYHENPYIVMPIEFLGDPLLAFTHAANKIALYGPVWIFLTGIPYWFGFGNFIITLFSFKIFIMIFYLSSVFLIWRISKSKISVILFSFNPLVVIETLVSGHNDIVMMFFALLSLYFLKQKKIALGLLAISISILIKYATFVLLPVFIYVLWATIQKKKLEWDRVFIACAGAMFFIFLLSPLREEIYSWYAIWFIMFACLIATKRYVLYICLAFSFSLMLRYIPYMLTGSYLGYTQVLKEIISFSPPLFICIYYVFKKKV